MACEPLVSPAPLSAALQLADVERVDFDARAGLLPAIVQHAGTAAVLMLGYMNRDALRASLTRGRVVFFSRSRRRLWEKGETSGHTLDLVQIRSDCDGDALLVSAWPRGPTCHRGSVSCFGASPASPAPLAFLDTLGALIDERMRVRPTGSYTARLAAGGPKAVAQKVGEEGVELALAGVAGSEAEVVAEAADVLYHLLVLLQLRGLPLATVVQELERRHAART
jgi:phosphoribosyl-ATP pyrophosphohydrolase/phosphoribosyl-AMP cyclohydrolase